MNGCVYHHSSSQTPTVKKEPKDTSNLRTRETQTFQTRTLAVQSYRESGEWEEYTTGERERSTEQGRERSTEHGRVRRIEEGRAQGREYRTGKRGEGRGVVYLTGVQYGAGWLRATAHRLTQIDTHVSMNIDTHVDTNIPVHSYAEISILRDTVCPHTHRHAIRWNPTSFGLGLGCSTGEYHIISSPQKRWLQFFSLLCIPHITSSPLNTLSSSFNRHHLPSSSLPSSLLPSPSGTQMERVDLTIDDSRDRYKLSGAYTTSYEVEVLKKKKCIEIQR
jgi:hypothetical protein